MPKRNKLQQARLARVENIRQLHYKSRNMRRKRAQSIQFTHTKKMIKKEMRTYETKRKFGKVAEDKQHIHLVKSLLAHKLPLMQCNHVLIGSSLAYKLISCRLTPLDTHRMYLTKGNRFIGSIAESAVAAKYNCKRNQQCYASSVLPFICSTPDIVFKDRIIEVKSSKDDIHVNKQTMLQILISMEILGHQNAELHIYKTRTEYEGRDKYYTKCIKVVGIRKTGTLFSHAFIIAATLGYVNYIQLLWAGRKIILNPCDTEAIYETILENANHQIEKAWKVPVMKTTPWCRYVLSRATYPLGLSQARINDIRNMTDGTDRSSQRYSYYSSKLSSYALLHNKYKERIKNTEYEEISLIDSMYSKFSSVTTIKESDFDKQVKVYPRSRSYQRKTPSYTLEEGEPTYSAYIFDNRSLLDLVKHFSERKKMGKEITFSQFLNFAIDFATS